MTDFPFKTKPYDHQLKVFERSKDSEYFALFMDQGTGKSKVVIDTAAYAFMKGRISAVLLFANKGVYGNWYYEELPKHSPIPYRAFLWRGFYDISEHKQFASILERGDLVWFFVNVDALTVGRFEFIYKKFVKAHPAHMLVADESTSIKNFKSKRTKAAMKMSDKASMRRIMSGLPNPQSPLDLFSQTQFLKPSVLGHSSYYSFKNSYAVMKIVRYGTRSFATIDGFRNLDTLRGKLLKFSAIIKKEECLDLPPKIYKTLYVDLTDKQKKAYDELIKRAVTYLDEHEITAVNALALVTRLLQICCGQLKVGKDEYLSIENNRLQATEDLVEEASSKVVVWTSYRRTAVDLLARLRDIAVLLPGGLDPEERQARLTQFRTGKTRVLIANPASSGHGITLTEANLVIYYSNTYNLEHRIQSEDRTHRIGQTSAVQYIDLVAPHTKEIDVIQALKDKKNLADQVTKGSKSLKEWLLS